MRGKQQENLISRQYKRNSPFMESWRRIRTNPGAVFGLCLLLLIILMTIGSFFFISTDQITTINPSNRFSPPSAEYPFGTDDMGRDLFLRTIYGSRYSLAIGFGAVGFGLVIGVFMGAIAGYFGGTLEEVLMRVTDVIASIPALLLGMVIVSVIGPGLMNLLIAVGFSSIAGFIRMTRAAVLTVKGNEYVESAKAIGMSQFRIIFTQVLPNSISPLIVSATSRMATTILSAAGLSFLGFGVPVPLPEWGALIAGGRAFMKMAPHLTLFPGLFIMAITFACALLGDGLRDALDPRLKQ